MISTMLLASEARQFLFSMGQSGALVVVVVAFAVVVVALAVVAFAVVEAMVVVSDPPPPPGGPKHASVWRTAAMVIKRM